MELRDFREDFIENIKVDAYSSGEGSQAAFVSAMADCLVDAEVLPDFNPAYYDQIGRRNRRLRVDGYVLDEVDFTMNLIIADYLGEKSDPRKFGKADLTQAVNRVMHFVEACLDDTLEVDISTPPSDLRDDIQHYRTDIRNYRILIFTDAERRSTLKAIEAFDIDGKHTECQIWDIDRVFRVCGSNSGRQEIEIDFTQYTAKGIPCLRASDAISKEYEGFLCIIPGVVLANIYDRYGSALLEGNVRSFLSTKVAVNKKIRGTILNNPERFFAYNNGVSATALELTFDATGNFITGAKDFQIINGGQTTASLSNARFKDKAPLDNIYVQMKLTKIGAMDEESATDLIRNISRSSNSQNKVSDADFFSTHPFHVEMEKFSQRIFAPAVEGQQYETHWFYERARGQYLQAQMRMTKGEQKRFKMQNPKSQVITKTDLAKVRNSWAKMPQLVSKGAQTNFVKYAESIDSAWTDNSAQFNEKYFTDSVALLIIFKRLEKIIPEQPWYQSGYRANIVTYSMAVLHLLIERQFPGRELDLQIIWNRQSVPEVIENALISLLKTKPLEKITVKEICEMAMINRSTFYKHYQDCYDLAERLKQRAMHDFMETLQGMKEGEATEMITALLEKMRENSDLFHTLGRHEGEQNFINTLAVSCFAYMNEQIDVLKKMDLDESGKKMVSSYVTGGSVGRADPDEWSDLCFDDYYSFYLSYRLHDQAKRNASLAEPVDRTMSGMPMQTLNACYNPSMNNITITAAITIEPMFSADQDYYTNLGALGAIIGHEMGHAFDSNCIAFDQDGNYNPSWICDEDIESLNARNAQAISYFEDNFTVFGVYHVDGEQTLGENYADLGGVECIVSLCKTKEDRIEPVTDEVTLTASSVYISALGKYTPRARLDKDKNATAYASWFEAAYQPVAPSQQPVTQTP